MQERTTITQWVIQCKREQQLSELYNARENNNNSVSYTMQERTTINRQPHYAGQEDQTKCLIDIKYMLKLCGCDSTPLNPGLSNTTKTNIFLCLYCSDLLSSFFYPPQQHTHMSDSLAYHYMQDSVLCIWYDIYFLTAIGLSPGGRCTVHIYIQTIHRTIQSKQYTEQHNNKSAGHAPSWLVIPWHLPYNRGKSTEKPQSG
jgi:hypothetical protein